MKFVKTATAEKSHILDRWEGSLMWMVCGQIVDMGRSSVVLTEKAPEEICGICDRIETENAYIPGASR